MDKIEPKEKKVIRKITYKNTWPAVRHIINGDVHSHRPVSVELRVINGKVEDVIINGQYFILDVNHGTHRSRKEGERGDHGEN